MTAQENTTEIAPRITLDDVKHRAAAIKDLAVSDAKDAVAKVTEADLTKKVLIVAGVVIFAASFAYYLGSRAGRGRVEDIY
jgi:hypothetical protein